MMQALVIILWLVPLAVWALPRMCSGARRILRSRDGFALALLAVAAIIYAYPSSASKSNPPEPPEPPKPPAVESRKGVIRLYYHAADGRLVPFDAPIRKETAP